MLKILTYNKVRIKWKFFNLRGDSGGGLPQEPLEKISAIFFLLSSRGSKGEIPSEPPLKLKNFYLILTLLKINIFNKFLILVRKSILNLSIFYSESKYNIYIYSKE